MKILIITTMLPHLGGAQTHINLLIDSLRKMEQDVSLFQVDERFITKIFALLSYFFTNWKKTLSFHHNYIVRPFYIKQKLKVFSIKNVPSIIVAQDPWAVIISKKVFPSVPVIQTIHGPLFEHSKEGRQKDMAVLSLLKEIEIQSFKLADRIIAVDHGQAELAEKKGADNRKIAVVFNAIDYFNLLDLSKGLSIVGEDYDYIVITRRLAPKNGVKYGLLGYLQCEAKSKLKLVIVGNGIERFTLQEIVEKNHLVDKVIFLDAIDRKRLIPILAKAKICLIPSVPDNGVIEATSLTALESLALRVPTIASSIGGLVEIDGGTNCLNLVPPGDPKALADKIDYIYENKDHSLTNVEAGVKRVIEEFDVRTWAIKMLDIYNQTMVDTGNLTYEN